MTTKKVFYISIPTVLRLYLFGKIWNHRLIFFKIRTLDCMNILVYIETNSDYLPLNFVILVVEICNNWSSERAPC